MSETFTKWDMTYTQVKEQLISIKAKKFAFKVLIGHLKKVPEMQLGNFLNFMFLKYIYSRRSNGARTVGDFVANKDFHLMFNLPIRGSGSYRISAYRTPGYKTRRMAIDNGIPLVTDIKCAKLYIAALKMMNCRRPATNSQYDCLASSNLLRLPGLIDVHVREFKNK